MTFVARRAGPLQGMARVSMWAGPPMGRSQKRPLAGEDCGLRLLVRHSGKGVAPRADSY